MAKDIGTERVLASLGHTIEGMSTIELGPHQVPSTDSVVVDRGEPSGSARFIERKIIGVGGFGEVVEAFDTDLKRRVALKRTRKPGDGRSARLIEEAQITAQLDHPSIPAVHSLGADAQGRPFFSMAYIEGMSLAELAVERLEDPDTARLYDTRRVLRLFTQVCYAVAFAHERGVLHRDIKPENVMIGPFGEVWLMDWGISKVAGAALRDEALALTGQRPPVEVSAQRPETSVGAVLGTPGFMAPEQASGEPLDARADVYALGATLFAALTGQPPVTGSTTLQVLMKTARGELTPLKSLTQVEGPLEAIIHKALAHAPQDRYASVSDMVVDIEAYLSDHRVAALDESLARRAVRAYFSRDRRGARMRVFDLDMLALGCFLLGLGVGGLTSHWFEGWAWALICAGALACLPAVYTYLRQRRDEDPDLRRDLREGKTPTGHTGSSDDDPLC